MGWGQSASGKAARVWAVGLAIAFLVVGAITRDVEALAFGAGAIVAGQLTRLRKGLLGRIALALLAIDTAAWMIPAAVINAGEGESLGAVLAPAILSVLSFGVLALVVSLPPLPVLGGGMLLLVGAVVWSIVAAGEGPTPKEGDIVLRAHNASFGVDVVGVTNGGTLAIRNDDLFWHTFTVSELDIDLRLPTRSTRTVTIDFPPGTYKFTCAIPGHDQAGMNGTLMVA